MPAKLRSSRAFGRRLSWRMVLVAGVLVVAALAVAGCGEPVFEQQHAFLWQNGAMIDLGTLGGEASVAYAINESGQITGWADTTDEYEHAFLYTRGAMRDLGTLGGSYSVGRDVNKYGQVAGSSETAGGSEHAFVWRSGKMWDLGTLGGDESRALAIDDLGRVVGWAEASDGTRHACTWWGAQVTDLGTAGGENGEVAGIAISYAFRNYLRATSMAGYAESDDEDGTGTAVLWTNGVPQVLAPLGEDTWSRAYAVNVMGQVAGESGGYTDIFIGTYPFTYPVVWQRGVATELDLLDDTDCGRAYSINNGGDSVGMCWDEDAEPSRAYATAWFRGEAVYLGTLGNSSLDDSVAYDINGRRQVVGASEYLGMSAPLNVRVQAALASVGESAEGEGLVAAHAVGRDSAGQIVYDAEWSGDRLQAALEDETIDPPIPAEVVDLTITLTGRDEAGAEWTQTLQVPWE